jgi:hypothetical protein
MKQQENASKLEEQQKHKAHLHHRLYVWKHDTNCKAWNKSGLGKRLTPFTIRVPHDIKFLNLSMWRRE